MYPQQRMGQKIQKTSKTLEESHVKLHPSAFLNKDFFYQRWYTLMIYKSKVCLINDALLDLTFFRNMSEELLSNRV
jgi:hypothetical protein